MVRLHSPQDSAADCNGVAEGCEEESANPLRRRQSAAQLSGLPLQYGEDTFAARYRRYTLDRIYFQYENINIER